MFAVVIRATIISCHHIHHSRHSSHLAAVKDGNQRRQLIQVLKTRSKHTRRTLEAHSKHTRSTLEARTMHTVKYGHVGNQGLGL